MRKGSYRICTILIVIFFLTLFQGCSKISDENIINVYTALEEEYVNQYLQEFNKVHPEVKVNIIRDSTGVVASKLTVEKDNPQADVMWGINSSNVLFLDKYNLFKPYKPANIDNIDKRFYDTKNEIPHWMGISVTTVALTVNTTELEKKNLPIPTSYEDLLNPVYKGEVIMPNPASSGTGYSALSSFNQIFGEEGTWSYLDRLNKNIGQYSHSGSAPTKQTATGEYMVGIGMDFLSIQMEKKDKNIKTIFPKEGSGWDVEISALINKSKIKSGAIKFYEWSMSEKAMELYANNRSLVTSTDNKHKKSEFAKSLDSMIDNNLISQSENRKRLIKIWEEKYGAGE